MIRDLIIGAVCLLLGAGIGWWASGSYCNHLAKELRECETQLDAR